MKSLLNLLLLFFLLAPTISASKLELKLSPLNLPMNYSSFVQSDDFDNWKSAGADMSVNGSKKETNWKSAGAEASANSLSKTKAVVLSLLLPGAGQYYAGAKGRAEVFIGAELAVWAGVLAFHTYGNWKEDDYIRYAERHAGIHPSGKDDDFFKNLTFYDNRDDYNTAGRIINPSAPYYPHTQSYYWQWESNDARLAYRSIRNASKTAFRKATFMIGMAVFNRIISGIDSFWVVKKMTQQTEPEEEFSEASSNKVKVKFNANPFGHNPSVSLNLLRQF